MSDTFRFTSPAVCARYPAVFDARKKPFSLHGLYRPWEDGAFKRLPQSVAERINDRARVLYTNTAGARLRFCTDSSFIALGAVYPPTDIPSARTAALSGAGAICFDLYADGAHVAVMWHERLLSCGNARSFELENGHYEAIADLEERKMREITLFFPAFTNVSEIYVGLEDGAHLCEAKPYRNQAPVVFYGSSITQGACASRAGNSYANILSRRFDFDFINLGFASGCHAEDAVIDYLCAQDMSLLVFDYDHNAPSPAFLEQTHFPALKRLREAKPDVPFVVLSKPNLFRGEEITRLRASIIENSCRAVSKMSDAPVHFVNGFEIYKSLDKDVMTMDGTHPTDLGFFAMASALEKIFSRYF